MDEEKQTQALQANTQNIQSMEQSIEKAERYFKIIKRVTAAALNLTSPNDWCDQQGNPYLEKSGCDKIAVGFGISVDAPKIEREDLEDDRGKYAIYTVGGTGTWNNNTASEIGTCSSRDDFFAQRNDWNHKDENGKPKKILLPLSEIDLCDIKRKAHTNWMNRLIKRLLGLSFTWEELSEATAGRISQATVTKKVKYDTGSKGGDKVGTLEGKDVREMTRGMILDMADNEENAAKEMLVKFTGFTNRDGKAVPGKSHITELSEKALLVTYGKVKDAYIKWYQTIPEDKKIATYTVVGDDVQKKAATK